MAIGPYGGGTGEVQRLRRAYESSLSWRVTRPLRAAARVVRTLRPSEVPDGDPRPPEDDGFDSWLEQYYGAKLEEIDRACGESAGPGRYALFRELDDDLWALLLTKQYKRYPKIRALLPDMPEAELQERWTGRSGVQQAIQSKAFYVKLREGFKRHADKPLSAASVLDFGCGWGRLTRYLARDVTPGRLYGCDPVEEILDVCRVDRVPATLARSAFLPDELPFDQRFDLEFAFSVFTHLSEAAHERCLHALHRALAPQGILIVTVRPPAYVDTWEPMHLLLNALGSDAKTALSGARYLFHPHIAFPEHPQYGDTGEMEYGDTVITMDYIRDRWSSLFELLEVNLLLEDPHQVVLTMRRV